MSRPAWPMDPGEEADARERERMAGQGSATVAAPPRGIGEVLIEMGAITQDVLQVFLKRQRRLLAALSAGMAAAAAAHGLPARSS